MSLELAIKALEEAQAAVDRELALKNAIKMKVRIKRIEEARREAPYSCQVTEDGDLEDADSCTSVHRHELEASISGYDNRIIPVIMVYIDEINECCMVYTDSDDGQMYVVNEVMVASYIHETAEVSYKRISSRIDDDVSGYCYSQEYREKLKQIMEIYNEQRYIDYALIKEYSEPIDTDLILRTEQGNWYYQDFFGYDVPTL